eukprot:scaffold59908_cov18-Tisochrysis_lutea.AAC.1
MIHIRSEIQPSPAQRASFLRAVLRFTLRTIDLPIRTVAYACAEALRRWVIDEWMCTRSCKQDVWIRGLDQGKKPWIQILTQCKHLVSQQHLAQGPKKEVRYKVLCMYTVMSAPHEVHVAESRAYNVPTLHAGVLATGPPPIPQSQVIKWASQ